MEVTPARSNNSEIYDPNTILQKMVTGKKLDERDQKEWLKLPTSAMQEIALKGIVARSVPPLFRMNHINVPPTIGLIGDRGGGKSSGTSVIGLVDCAFAGQTMFSNMDVNAGFEVDNETARNNGLPHGGIVKYDSQPLDKEALLNLDERYMNSCIMIEEINVQYSNVRRTQANTNVDFNQVCQQLRKFNCTLIYNVINEMFIDPQLRSMTDIFIRTYDTAFDIEAMRKQKPSGDDFRWTIYPMTAYFAGEQGRWSKMHKTESVLFPFKNWHGIFNSDRYQRQGRYTMSTREKNQMLSMEVTDNPEIADYNDEWSWLQQNVISFCERNPERSFLEAGELHLLIGTTPTPTIKKHLQTFGVFWNAEEQCFLLPQSGLGEGPLSIAARPLEKHIKVKNKRHPIKAK